MLKYFLRSNRPFNALSLALALIAAAAITHRAMVPPWLASTWSWHDQSWRMAMAVVLGSVIGLYIFYFPYITKGTKRLVLFLREITGNKHINRRKKIEFPDIASRLGR